MKIKRILAFLFVFVCFISAMGFEFFASTEFHYYKIKHEDLKYTLSIGLLPKTPTFTKDNKDACEELDMTAEDVQEYLAEKDAVLCQYKKGEYQILVKVKQADISSWNSYSASDWVRESKLKYASWGYKYLFFTMYQNNQYTFLKTYFDNFDSGRKLFSYCVIIDDAIVEIVMETHSTVKDSKSYESLFEDMIDTLYYSGSVLESNSSNNNSESSSSHSNNSNSSSGASSSEYSSSSKAPTGSSSSSSSNTNSKNNSNIKVHIKKSTLRPQNEYTMFSAAVVWVVFNSVSSAIWAIRKLKRKEKVYLFNGFERFYSICNLLFLVIAVVNIVVSYFCFSKIFVSFLVGSLLFPLSHLLLSFGLLAVIVMLIFFLGCIFVLLSSVLPFLFDSLVDSYWKLIDKIISCNMFFFVVFNLCKYLILLFIYYYVF